MRVDSVMYYIKNYSKMSVYVLDGSGSIYEIEPDVNIMKDNLIMGGVYPFENQVVIMTKPIRKDGLSPQEKYIRIDCPEYYNPTKMGYWIEEVPNFNLVFSDRESVLQEYRSKYGNMVLKHGTIGCGTISTNGIQYGILNCATEPIYVADAFGIMKIEPGEDHIKEYDNLFYKKFDKPSGYIKVFRTYGLVLSDDKTEATFKLNSDIYDLSSIKLKDGLLLDYINAIVFNNEDDAKAFISKYNSIETYRRQMIISEMESVIRSTTDEFEKKTNQKIKTTLLVTSLISAINIGTFITSFMNKKSKDKNNENELFNNICNKSSLNMIKTSFKL